MHLRVNELITYDGEHSKFSLTGCFFFHTSSATCSRNIMVEKKNGFPHYPSSLWSSSLGGFQLSFHRNTEMLILIFLPFFYRIMKRIMGWGERFISIILLFCCPQERTIWWRKIDLCWFSAQLQTGRLTTLIKGRMMEGFGPDLDMEILKHPNTISMVTNRCSRHLNLEECDPIWPKQSQIPFFSAARWWVILHDTNM